MIAEPAAGVGEEMAHRDALGDVGVREPSRQIAPDWSVQIQLALLHELQGQCAGHGLRDRADLEEGRWVDLEWMLYARDPEAGRLLGAFVVDAYGRSRHAEPLERFPGCLAERLEPRHGREPNGRHGE